MAALDYYAQVTITPARAPADNKVSKPKPPILQYCKQATVLTPWRGIISTASEGMMQVCTYVGLSRASPGPQGASELFRGRVRPRTYPRAAKGYR